MSDPNRRTSNESKDFKEPQPLAVQWTIFISALKGCLTDSPVSQACLGRLEMFFRDWQRLREAYFSTLAALQETRTALDEKTAKLENLEAAYEDLHNQRDDAVDDLNFELADNAQLLTELNRRDEMIQSLQRQIEHLGNFDIPRQFQAFF